MADEVRPRQVTAGEDEPGDDKPGEVRLGRVYAGKSSAAREAQRRQNLLDAAIDMLIAGDKLTVRGVCTRTGLTSRYFYENFRSTDDLAETAYDTCVADIAAAVTAAFDGPAELDDQIRSAMTALVASLEANPRAGHVLFSHRISNRLISRKRQESTAFFAQITAAAADASTSTDDAAVNVELASQFVVGGVTQLLSVWLNEIYRGEDGGSGGAGSAKSAAASTSSATGPATGAERTETEWTGTDGAAVARTAATMIGALAAQLANDLDDDDDAAAPPATEADADAG